MSQISVSGAVSGIDTAGLINSLVSVQQNQQALLRRQQTQQQKAADTFGNLISSLGNLSDLAKKVAKTSAWSGVVATSSSTGVTASATGTQAGSLTFDVTSTAKAHSLVSQNTVGSLSTQVASGPLTFTKQDGSTVEVQTGSGSLADVIAAVNASSAGITASAVQTSPGQYRLQLSATGTGAASQFTVSGLTGFSGLNILTQASDAQITVGTNPATAFTVTSSTNTFAAVVPGLSFTVSRLESGVTVGSTVDGSAVADDVRKLVDAANTVLSSIQTATQWNATTKSGGALVGDSTARSLQQSILNLVGSSGAPGVSLTRSGRLSFDESTFTTAFAADPKAVAAKFGATASFSPASGVTGSVGYSSSTLQTRAGAYAVQVSALAAKDTWEIDGSVSLAAQTIEITKGTETISYTVGPTDTLQDVADALNDEATAAGMTLSIDVDGTDLVLAADSVGSAGAFTVTMDSLAQNHTITGADVQGTIDGQTATGAGTRLTSTGATTGAKGLVVDVAVSSADLTASGGAVGTMTVAPGLAQRLVQLAAQQTETGTGMLSSAKSGRESAVKGLQNQIDDWDRRLTTYRASLQAQFTAMETTLSALRSQSSFLASYGSSTSTAT
jgi:flagellar hook-associated protein 2